MINNIQLTEKELLYISMVTDIENIWGVGDPFRDMDEEAIKMDILRMQMSLLQKGYAFSEEDGQFTLAHELTQIFKECAESKLIYIFSTDEMEKKNIILRYFSGSDRVFRFEFNNGASFSEMSKDQVRKELTEKFVEGDSEVTVPNDCMIASSSRLKRLGSLSRKRFIQELKDLGCEDNFSTIIAEGLQGNSSFRILLCFRMGDSFHSTPIDKLVTIHSPAGNLIATADLENNADTICFTRMGKEQLHNSLCRILDRVDEGV